MNTKDFSEAMGEVDTGYVEKAANYQAKSKSRNWVKWGAMAACLCIAVAGSLIFALSDTNKQERFVDMINEGNIETTMQFINVEVGERTARYEGLVIESERLEKYVGEQYLKNEDSTFFIPDETKNLKYLINRNADGELSLWVFSCFEAFDGETYTYGDVLKTIYGVKSADDIVSVISTPSNSGNTELDREIQEKISTSTYTDKNEIEKFYGIVSQVICFGADSESKADDSRFTYSFSTDGQDKMISGESTYGTRFIKVTLKDGTIIDSWNYSALSGSFFEFGGVFTQPLEDGLVYELNDLLGIK